MERNDKDLLLIPVPGNLQGEYIDPSSSEIINKCYIEKISNEYISIHVSSILLEDSIIAIRFRLHQDDPLHWTNASVISARNGYVLLKFINPTPLTKQYVLDFTTNSPTKNLERFLK